MRLLKKTLLGLAIASFIPGLCLIVELVRPLFPNIKNYTSNIPVMINDPFINAIVFGYAIEIFLFGLAFIMFKLIIKFISI